MLAEFIGTINLIIIIMLSIIAIVMLGNKLKEIVVIVSFIVLNNPLQS